MMTSTSWIANLHVEFNDLIPQAKGEIEMSSYKTLTSIITWTCFLFGMISMVVPTIIGIATGGLAGTINTVEAGQLWFYRHGLSWLIGIALFIAYLFAVRVRKELE